MGLVGDCTLCNLFFRERSGRLIQSGDLTFVRIEEGHLVHTPGLKAYLGLLAAGPAALGFGLDVPKLPASIQHADQLRVLRPASSHKPCVLVSDDGTVYKVHQTRHSFSQERSAFQALRAAAPMHATPILTLLTVNDTDIWMSFRPYCRFSLRDVPFSDALFARVCTSAATVVSQLWRANLAYLDPSPSNVLVDEEQQVYWNDFGLACPMGQVVDAFVGTPAFASTRFHACLSGSHVTVSKLDDMQAVFFTLLSFVWDDASSEHRRRLPWEHDNELQVVCDQKAAWVTTQQPFHVRPQWQSLMRAFLELCFPRDALAACDVAADSFLSRLTEVMAGDVTDPVDVGVARTLFHDCSNTSCPVSKTSLKRMSRFAAQSQNKSACTVCFPGERS